MFPGAPARAWEENAGWLAPDHWEPDTGRTVIALQSWVLRSNGRTVLVDTGAGDGRERPGMAPYFHHRQEDLVGRLRGAGVRPEDIDVVVNTHLHVDHVGWNTFDADGTWAPTFPNARYLIPAADDFHFGPQNSYGGGTQEVERVIYEDSVVPVHQAGLVVLWDGEHRIDEHLTLESAPGNTPGSSVLRLASGSDRAVFVGDLLHSPLQIVDPCCNSNSCLAPEQAVASRRRVLQTLIDASLGRSTAHLQVAVLGTVPPRVDGVASQAARDPRVNAVNDDKLYPIGDVAHRTGLSVSAIRFYADAGVIPPTAQTDAGYRLYDVDAIARLELVRTLRELGAGLDEIRRLLGDDTTLHDLATTHLALVDRQMRQLRTRRAVLHTIVNQRTPTEQVTLMHTLASMSDDDRSQLLDRFWDEVTDGLTVHPAFVEHLHQMRPHLPEDPTTEQLQAWMELADLVRDEHFRRSVREFFHNAFSSSRALEATSPAQLERIEEHRLIEVEASEARQAGLSPDAPRAREIAERLVASIAGLAAGTSGVPLGEQDLAEVRNSLAAPDRTTASIEEAEHAVPGFTDLLDRYVLLMATIDGTPQPDHEEARASEQWVAAALRASGPQQEPAVP